MKGKLNCNKIEEIKTKLKKGNTYRELAIEYNVSWQRIGQIAQDNGLAGIGVKIRQEKKAKVLGYISWDEYCEYRDKKYCKEVKDVV